MRDVHSPAHSRVKPGVQAGGASMNPSVLLDQTSCVCPRSTSAHALSVACAAPPVAGREVRRCASRTPLVRSTGRTLWSRHRVSCLTRRPTRACHARILIARQTPLPELQKQGPGRTQRRPRGQHPVRGSAGPVPESSSASQTDSSVAYYCNIGVNFPARKVNNVCGNRLFLATPVMRS